MKRTHFVAGNWKMNLNKADSVALAKAIAAKPLEGVDVGVAPPFVYIDAVAAALVGSKVHLGAQDLYPAPNGAFTGEVSIDMLKDLCVSFVLTGHSERRHVIKEPGELIAKKAAAVYDAGLYLVHCVGEKLEERDANKTLDVVKAHLDEIKPIKIVDTSRLVIAYEPVWAIGTGRTATDEQAQEVHAYIRSYLKAWLGNDGDAVRIQYGGSVKPDNAKGLMTQPDVDGALVGGAALKADSFLAIAEAAR